MAENEEAYGRDREIMDAILAFDLRLSRLEATLAKVITRIDPTVSYAQTLETLRT